jgi:hypothetical protein
VRKKDVVKQREETSGAFDEAGFSPPEARNASSSVAANTSSVGNGYLNSW